MIELTYLIGEIFIYIALSSLFYGYAWAKTKQKVFYTIAFYAGVVGMLLRGIKSVVHILPMKAEIVLIIVGIVIVIFSVIQTIYRIIEGKRESSD